MAKLNTLSENEPADSLRDGGGSSHRHGIRPFEVLLVSFGTSIGCFFHHSQSHPISIIVLILRKMTKKYPLKVKLGAFKEITYRFINGWKWESK